MKFDHSPRCRVCIVDGQEHSGGGATHAAMIVVPGATPCMVVNPSLAIIGYDDALRGHMEISFELPRVLTAGR